MSLISKYNVPGPRYTSYPTVPYWGKEQWEESEWIRTIKQGINLDPESKISLYIHLPFCESLCTFCGCHKYITRQHSLALPYINTVIKEFDLIRSKMDCDFVISDIHLGGGTPTFCSVEELTYLIQELKKRAIFSPSIELSFEANPATTNREQLQALYELGFRRVSFGIQDYNETVQYAINRVQSVEDVQNIHFTSKEIGYESISHDLVYGLPKQQLCGFKKTIDQTISLKPDRISLYSYAHVPWVKGTGQRGFNENDLPNGTAKRTLYELAKDLFTKSGYVEIGMDHFALPGDSLATAMKTNRLHRNFMGYTTKPSPVLIGLGMSAISDSWFGFAQNEKNLKQYTQRIESGNLAITKGHLLNTDDIEIRQHILNLMCRFETQITNPAEVNLQNLIQRLLPMIEDGLVEVSNAVVRITPKGIPFVRNCCMAFDKYLLNSVSEKSFSLTI